MYRILCRKPGKFSGRLHSTPVPFYLPAFRPFRIKASVSAFSMADFSLPCESPLLVLCWVYLTRLCLIVFTSAFGYFFFTESSVYTNHYYLIFLLSFLMCLGHSGSAFSFDSLISKRGRRKQVDYWEIFLLRFQICVVFFFGAMAKLNADWLIHAAPLYLNLIKNFSFLGYPLHEKWMAVVLSWGGMLTDLGLGILLAINRWPKLAFIWLCLFNGMNVFLFGLGIKTFPYLMVSSYILFLPSPIVRESIARFTNGNVFKKVARLDRT